MTLPALLTEPEAAAQLRCCTKTLRKARDAGQLSWVKVGRRICYTPQDLADFIDTQRQCTPSKRTKTQAKPKNRRGGKVIPFSQRA